MTPIRMFPCLLAVCLVLGLCVASANAQTIENSTRPVTTTIQTGGRARHATDPVIISRAEDEGQNVTPPLDVEATRPVLVNDIVILSRADVSAPGRSRTVGATGMVASANTPSIWPVAGSLRGGVGFRRNPFGGMSFEYHKGQDISAPSGTSVIATADGVVVTAGWQRGYGRVVYVDHGNGISTRYGHLSRIDVAVGQVVKRGEQLGLVGSSGRSTAPHLHYEVRINGQPANPINYLPAIAVASNPINGYESHSGN
jgi:murein DD-endopeptidase MepM/ murein hydrolase activator NlpD